jgi:hypothetical protein
MPLYVYACTHLEHTERRNVIKAMHEEPAVLCSVCELPMERVPQAFSFYQAPIDTLYETYDKKFRDYRAKKAPPQRKTNNANEGRIRK